MSKNDFLLHYPDGECSSTPRDGVKPDAFLFKKDRLNAYWVSLPIKIEAVSRPYAIETARKTKFNGHPCRLLNVFDLWVMLKHIRKINDLLRELGMPELLVKEEAAAYWSQKQPHYSGIRWTGSSFSNLSKRKRHLISQQKVPFFQISRRNDFSYQVNFMIEKYFDLDDKIRYSLLQNISKLARKDILKSFPILYEKSFEINDFLDIAYNLFTSLSDNEKKLLY